jgi:long-subunit fatty acid transport protein
MGQTAMQVQTDMRLPGDMTALTRVLGEATEGLEIPIVSQLTLPSPWFGGGISPYDKVAQLKMTMRDDFTPSFNLGILWSPYHWLSLGAVYQSEISTELIGNYSVQYSKEFAAMIDWMSMGTILPTQAAMLDLPTSGEDQRGYIASKVKFPQRIQLGLKFEPVNYFKFLFDVHWADYSVVKEDRFSFDQPMSFLRFAIVQGYQGSSDEMIVKRNLKDTVHWSSGIEISPADWLSFRFGYEFRPTSVRKKLYDAMYCLPDMHNFGSGIGIKLKNGMELDFGFSYIYNEKIFIPADSSTNMSADDFTLPVYNPYTGLDYEQKTNVYIGAFNVSMPLEVMSAILHHQKEAIKKLYHLLNPFD